MAYVIPKKDDDAMCLIKGTKGLLLLSRFWGLRQCSNMLLM